MSESVFSTNELTVREWHAAVLGAVTGAFTASLRTVDYTDLGVSLAVVFVAAALGIAAYGSTASRTVKREPWYAHAAFLVGGAVGLTVA